MLRYLLDTDICIHVIKNRPPEMHALFNQRSEHLAISSVTLAELVHGAEKSARREKNLDVVEGFAARLEVLAFGEKAAVHSGQIRAELARRGTPIGPYDVMIAGHARSEGLVVVSNNVGEFERVEGLRVENWLGG